jgi:hypothetical protein
VVTLLPLIPQPRPLLPATGLDGFGGCNSKHLDRFYEAKRCASRSAVAFEDLCSLALGSAVDELQGPPVACPARTPRRWCTSPGDSTTSWRRPIHGEDSPARLRTPILGPDFALSRSRGRDSCSVTRSYSGSMRSSQSGTKNFMGAQLRSASTHPCQHRRGHPDLELRCAKFQANGKAEPFRRKLAQDQS